jgi:hypothetical protein
MEGTTTTMTALGKKTFKLERYKFSNMSKLYIPIIQNRELLLKNDNQYPRRVYDPYLLVVGRYQKINVDIIRNCPGFIITKTNINANIIPNPFRSQYNDIISLNE